MPDSPAPGSPIRVLRVITRLNVGGPSIQAIELSTHLAARGYETLLVHGALGQGEGDMRYLLDGRAGSGYELRPLPSLRRPVDPVADLRATAALLRILKAFQPAILHTHMAKAGTVARTAAWLYNRTRQARDRVRVVHTYHGHVLDGYFSPAKTRAFVAVERLLARSTDRLVAISPQIRRELLEQYRIGRPGQYRVVPLGFDLDALAAIGDADRRAAREALQIPPGARVVTTVGRLTAIKQHGLFLEVAREVAARDPEAYFLVVGDGELRGDLERQARSAGLERRVRFCGWRRDLATVYGATDVFLLTSRNEGTPVALIEAMAAGCAAVSTDVGGVRDVIETPAVGRLAPFGDRQALTAHVLALLEDAYARRALGAQGRASVVARYGLRRLLDDVDQVYRDLLD
jgi:glycosyltransferase involved in cell wall biosynthesis